MKLAELLTHYFDLAARGVTFTPEMQREINDAFEALEKRIEELERQAVVLQQRTIGR
jgi:hypothetical protein